MNRKIFSRTLAMLMVVITLASLFPFTVLAAEKYKLTCIDCYDSDGKSIGTVKQVGKLHPYTYESLFKIEGERAYCIELEAHADSKADYIKTNKVWKTFSDEKQNLINMVIGFGLEGNGVSAGTKTVNGHNLPMVQIYGHTVTEYEAYMAVQLLVWEVTENYRSVVFPYKVKNGYSLVEAYTGTAKDNIKKVYNSIISAIQQFNIIPSLTGDPRDDNQIIPNYQFSVNYSDKDGYVIKSSAKKLTDKAKVMENYPDLAKNRSVAFKGNNKETRYLNVKAGISGNTLTLTPESVTKNAKYDAGKTVTATEKNVPAKNNGTIVAYGDEDSKKDIQDVVRGYDLDPAKAQYKLSVDYDYSTAPRNFRVEKTIQGTDGTELDDVKGYYFYIPFPDDFASQMANAHSLSEKQVKSKLWFNTDLGEYYTILGPTNDEGITGTIRTYLKRYNLEDCKEVPYGKYQVYELGKRATGFKVTDSINGDDSYIDKNVSHYAIPDGAECTVMNFKEHYQAVKNGKSFTKNIKTVDLSKTATEEITPYPTITNKTKIKLRIAKTAEDGNVKNVWFRITNRKTKKSIDIMTDSKGNIDEFLDFGEYEIEELGYGTQDDYKNGKLTFPDYGEKPDNKIVYLDGSAYDEFRENGFYAVSFVNTANVRIRIKKSSTVEPDKKVNGAVYGIYSKAGKLLEKMPETTTNMDVVTGKLISGFSQSKDYYQFGSYYVQEITAPPGYGLNPKQYHFTISKDTIDKIGKVLSKYITIEVEDPPTETYISKKDVTGSNEVPGATLTISQGDKIKYKWVSTTEPKLIYGLEKGVTYTLTEILPPDGFVTAESINFKINEDGTPTRVTMKDAKTKISFLKVDEKNQPLANATLQVFDAESNKPVTEQWQSTTTAKVFEGVFVVGKKYYLREIKAPSIRYKIAPDKYFTVADSNAVQSVTMVDNFNLGSVELLKQDTDGNTLAGAEFELYTSDGKPVKVEKISDGKFKVSDNGKTISMPTDKNGKLTVSEMEEGSYYFLETKAPAGRMLYGKKINFSVTASNDMKAVLKIKNDNAFLPNTGGNGYALAYAFGIGAMLISATVIIILRRKK